MKKITATIKELTIKEQERTTQIERKCETFHIESSVTAIFTEQRNHDIDLFSVDSLNYEYSKNIDFIKKFAKVNNVKSEWIKLNGRLPCHNLFRLFMNDGEICQKKMDDNIRISINKLNTQENSLFKDSVIPSTICINDGSIFNGVDFISSPDDTPSLSLQVNVLPGQYEYLVKNLTNDSILQIGVSVICFPEPSYVPPSEWFKDDVFFLETNEHGIDPVCLVESITIKNIKPTENTENTENTEDTEDTDGGALNEIKEHVYSADHGIYKILDELKKNSGMYFWQVFQTCLLAAIAWKLH